STLSHQFSSRTNSGSGTVRCARNRAAASPASRTSLLVTLIGPPFSRNGNTVNIALHGNPEERVHRRVRAHEGVALADHSRARQCSRLLRGANARCRQRRQVPARLKRNGVYLTCSTIIQVEELSIRRPTHTRRRDATILTPRGCANRAHGNGRSSVRGIDANGSVRPSRHRFPI